MTKRWRWIVWVLGITAAIAVAVGVALRVMEIRKPAPYPSSIPIYGEAEAQKVKEYLNANWNQEKRPYSFDGRDIVYFPVNGVQNGERIEQFFDHTAQRQGDAIVMAEDTIEGDPIIAYLSYDGNQYFYLADRTRDRYRGQDYEQVSRPYFMKYTEEAGDLYYLTDSASMTYEEIQALDGTEAAAKPFTSVTKIRWKDQKVAVSEEVQTAISSAVLHCNARPQQEAYCAVEAHLILKTEQVSDYHSIYMHMLYQEYDENGKQIYGRFLPAVLVFENNGSLQEFWTPGTGKDYEEQIHQRFPAELWERAMDGSNCVADLTERCQQQMEEFFNAQKTQPEG